MQLWVATAAARFAGWVSRLGGRGGSSLPGLVARRVAPQILAAFTRDLTHGAIVLTGTNGKTTTAAVAGAILAASGRRVIQNRSGANLILGLTAAVTAARSWGLKPLGDLVLLETDEATMPRACREISPRLVAVTNFFRDQLDRFGELSNTVDLVRRGMEYLAPGGVAVLNADDPQAAWLGRAMAAPIYYGLEIPAGEPNEDDGGDARFCPQCGSSLVYARRYYAHLGHYRCDQCGFSRPRPQVTLERVDGTSDRWLDLRLGSMPCHVPWALPGTYNLYNALCAAAIGWASGATAETLLQGFQRGRVAFGRMEQVVWRDREIRLALVKNPTGFNQVLKAVAEDAREKTVLIAINDRHADGRDVSWLWDVDFETLAPMAHVRRWWVSGIRAQDMAVRLKYAGVNADGITVSDGDPGYALEAVVEEGPTAPIYVLPTYTAMIEVRTRLERAGVVRHFREG